MHCRSLVRNILPLLLLPVFALSCSQKESFTPSGKEENEPKDKKVAFDVTVTRDGKPISQGAIATKADASSAEAADKLATMNPDIPFGLVGIDLASNTLLIDNKSIYNSGGGYVGYLDSGLWEIPAQITFSAYYPHVNSLGYGDAYESYTIPYSIQETEAGPLVSKTVQRAISQLNMMPLEFQHITNDIGYKISDITTDPQLQGLIHLRKVTATCVASAGVFLNDLTLNQGTWHRQGYYRDVVVFEGDAVIGVGMENEKFIGRNDLVDTMAESSRYYSIPDEILMGKQCVEVQYDVDSFTVENFTYPPIKNQLGRFMLYGILPNNVFEYGKQYTFHLGLDTGKLYQQIVFSASVSDWETKIYEDNSEF